MSDETTQGAADRAAPTPTRPVDRMGGNVCAACGRPFNSLSKPRWAFTREGRPAGRVHAAPCIPRRNNRFLAMGYAQTRDQAQFDVWAIYFYERPERDTPAWEAFILAEAPSEALSASQERLLHWWQTRPNDPLSAEHIAAIREAHGALIREYHAWKAALESAPSGCS